MLLWLLRWLVFCMEVKTHWVCECVPGMSGCRLGSHCGVPGAGHVWAVGMLIWVASLSCGGILRRDGFCTFDEATGRTSPLSLRALLRELPSVMRVDMVFGCGGRAHEDVVESGYLIW